MGQSTSPCSNCGTLNNIGDTYCSNCGFALDSTSAPTMVSGLNAPTIASLPGRRVTGTLAANQILGARYRVVQMVGKGGFGAVYQATDERFSGKRRVAVKEMSDAHLGPVERQRAIDNFRQEANILVDLKHPNLPDVSDFLEEGGKAYLVMEFIDGQTLEKLQENANAPLDEKLVMGWALQLCDVLEYLHTQAQPIIFRDLKPPNIMLTRTNQIKLIDFGIARVFKSSSAKDTETLGSQGYAPLEQYGRGQSDARTDIYALGATLYDLLTNTLPTASPLRRIQGLAGLRQLNPLISQGVEQVVLKAMEEMPDQRFQSASAMYNAIAQLGFSIGRTTSSGLATSSGATAATIAGAPTIAAQPAQQTVYANQQNTPQGAPTIAAGPPSQPGSYPSSSGGGIYMPTQPGTPYTPQPPQQRVRRVSRRGLLIGGGVAIVAAGTGAYLFSHKQTNTPATQSGNTIQILFASSTEKQDWMEAVAKTFNDSKQTFKNSPIQVEVRTFGSVDSQAQILSGQLKPVAWSPASNLEINRLNYKWQVAHNGNSIISSSEQFQPKSLVKSPLVLAAWPERAQKLLSYYHVQTLDWTTLASAFKASNWQDVGGEQTWGPVKFGQTLPTQSNSGLLTITLLAYHYFNEERGLTTTQVNDPDFWKFLDTFESAVNVFGHSTGTYLANDLIPGGAAEADIIATYENLILTLPNHPLTIYYPAVNILSDHPFAVLQGDWVTDEQKQAALIFRDYLLAVPQQQHALTYGFRPGNANVAVADTGVANNPFVTQNKVFASGQPDSLQAQAQSPDGNVVDALITHWNESYPNPSLANG